MADDGHQHKTWINHNETEEEDGKRVVKHSKINEETQRRIKSIGGN